MFSKDISDHWEVRLHAPVTEDYVSGWEFPTEEVAKKFVNKLIGKDVIVSDEKRIDI